MHTQTLMHNHPISCHYCGLCHVPLARFLGFAGVNNLYRPDILPDDKQQRQSTKSLQI